MPRLFTGLEIPTALRQRLSLMQGGLPGARWISQENYHLTLRFIGDVDHRTMDAVAEALAQIARPAFPLRLTALGAFGTSKPRALIVRAEATRELMDLQAEHERWMQRIGLAPEGRKYQPHVTLARLRNARPRDVADYLSLRGGFAAETFTVERFVLFSAREGTGGGPYLVEEAYPLATAGEEAA